MVTRSELKRMNVGELRTLLSEHFEGITADTLKAELTDIVEEHWEYLDAALNETVPEDSSEGDEEEAVEDQSEDQPDDEEETEGGSFEEPDPEPVEVSDIDPTTDLYTGRRV